jgi:acyl-CoA dehydrogenase
MSQARERHPELRSALRELCSRFPDAYFRRVDEERGYPSEFVDALTQAGRNTAVRVSAWARPRW